MIADQFCNNDRQMKVTYQIIQEDHRGLAQRKYIRFEMKLAYPSPPGHEQDS